MLVVVECKAVLDGHEFFVLVQNAALIVLDTSPMQSMLCAKAGLSDFFVGVNLVVRPREFSRSIDQLVKRQLVPALRSFKGREVLL